MMTKEGGKTLRATMIKKHGSEEALRKYYQRIGSIGGKLSRHGGFASELVGKDGLTGRDRAKKCGAIGGRKSRRTKVQKQF